MTEKMPPSLTPEQIARADQEKEDDEYLELLKRDHPELFVGPKELRESGSEITILENMMVLFESEHPLAELHKIIDLTTEEAKNHPIREPARLALNQIRIIIDKIKSETNITPAQAKELEEKYQKLSRAVGMINDNKVDHNR